MSIEPDARLGSASSLMHSAIAPSARKEVT